MNSLHVRLHTQSLYKISPDKVTSWNVKKVRKTHNIFLVAYCQMTVPGRSLRFLFRVLCIPLFCFCLLFFQVCSTFEPTNNPENDCTRISKWIVQVKRHKQTRRTHEIVRKYQKGDRDTIEYWRVYLYIYEILKQFSKRKKNIDGIDQFLDDKFFIKSRNMKQNI